MLDEIRIYITDRFTPEVCDSIESLFQVLDTLTDDDFQEPYIGIIMTDDNAEEGPGDERFMNLVYDNAAYILKLHGITLAEGVTLSDQIELIQGVVDLSDHDEKQAIIDQIEGSSDALEALAGVLQFTTTFEETKVYTMVEECDTALLRQLRTLAEGDSIEDGTQTAENNKIILTLKKLRDYMQYPTALGFQLINTGLPIGASFANYLRHYGDILKTKDVPLMAKELVVLLYMSGDSHGSPLVFFKEISSTLFDDLGLVTKMEIAITDLMNGFESTHNPLKPKEPENAQA